MQHCKSAKECDYEPKDASEELMHETDCGRKYTEFEIQLLVLGETTADPLPDPFDFDGTEEVLAKYIRTDETVGPYTAIFHPLCVRSRGNFDSLVSDMVDWWHKPVTDDEFELTKLHEFGKKWIYSTARRLTEMVPGNFRAALQIMDGQDVGETNQNFLYSFRHKESLVLPEVNRLLSFVWRHHGNMVVNLLERTGSRETMIVPCILQELLLEESPSFDSHPMLVEYCLARCLRRKGDGSLVMPQCGDVASIVATVMSILRAAVCSHMVYARMSDKVAKEFVMRAKSSRVLNIIAPVIRRLREMQRRKPKRRKLTTSPEGDISVDGFDFNRDQWSRVVPTVLAVCRDLLGLLYDGDDWSLFLESCNVVSVSRSERGDFHFSLLISGNQVQSNQLLFNNSDEQQLVLDRLASFVEIAFHGFGGGSTRFEELTKLNLWHGIWHRGTIYYMAESIKCYSFKSRPSGKMTEHKLPTVMARVFLLFRLAASQLLADCDNSLIPVRSKRTHKMTDAIAEIFNFSERPDATQVRQLWASVCNVTFPQDKTVIVAATEDGAEMSGHSVTTHRIKYGSELINGSELNYRKYHCAIGAFDDSTVSNDRLSGGDLSLALKNIFGAQASYTSNQQREAVLVSAAPRSRHSHVGLPCGSGKSLVWILPLAAAFISKKKIGMQIVVLPYNFLVCYQEYSAKEILEHRFDVSIHTLSTAECSQRSLPEKYAKMEELPDLVFLGVDAFQALIQKHCASLSLWASNGYVHRFILDEIHTLYGEYFRSAYEVYPEIAKFQTPIMTLSGSVHRLLVGPMHCYLNMSQTNDGSDFDLIQDGDLLGYYPRGFKISCTTVTEINRAVVERVEQTLSSFPNFGIHIICSSVGRANRLFTALKPKCRVELVTSEVIIKEQREIAAKWRRGEFQVLLSTTCALVGNENSRCRFLFTAGYLFNLMCVVQAWGRLRPNQRTSFGRIEMLINNLKRDQLEQAKRNDKLQCDLLLGKGIVTQQTVEPYMAVGSQMGLYQWAVKDPGCRVVALTKRFGIEGTQDCKVCDRCNGTPVAKLAVQANEMTTVNASLENKALRILELLKMKCLSCGRRSCRGEMCLTFRFCFKCGGRHEARDCKVGKDLKEVFQKRGCCNCFDLKSRRGYESHDFKSNECPLKRRLRRLVIAAWHKDTSQVDFVQFVSRTLCDKANFYQFVASHDNGSLGKR